MIVALLSSALITVVSAITVDDSEVFVIDAPANTVYFIYSDTMKTSKPLGTSPASPIDWTATGYLKGMTIYSQMEGLDTNSNLINQSSGAPKLSDKSIVISGGPCVQVLARYYEDNRIAPLYYGSANGKSYWFLKNGTRIDASGIAPNAQNDMFVVEHFLDSNGNAVLLVYGYSGLGTFAGARFFEDVIYPNIRNYTHSYYIYHWIDSNNNYFPELNEINPVPVAYGD